MNRDRVIGFLEELEAILTLEYHNKNHLNFGASPKRLNEDKRSIIKAALVELNDTETSQKVVETGLGL